GIKPAPQPAKPIAAAPLMKVRPAQKSVARTAVESSSLVPVAAGDAAVVVDAPVEVAASAVDLAPVASDKSSAPQPAALPETEPAVLASAEFENVDPPKTEPVPARASTPALSRGIFNMATSFDAASVANPAAAAQQAQAMLGGLNDRAKSAMQKSTKMGEEMTELTKGNVEAIVASGKIAAKGTESFVQEVVDYNKKTFETATAMFKSMAAVKSPTELFQLQTEYAKSSFDNAVAEASKFSEAFVKLAGEVVQPISNRYAIAAEKLKATAL
ncbi:MAG: TIGR01841 family phasin, partial [Sphingomonas sp.]